MQKRAVSLLLVLGCVALGSLGSAGCSSDDDDAVPEEGLRSSTGNVSPQPAPTTVSPGLAPPPPPVDDPGPAPAGCGTVTKDNNGFFTRTTPKSSYVGFVPKSYAGQPTMLVVGLHGCGDSALNFAKWGVNPYKTIGTQKHIGISIGGRDGQCWDTTKDVDKVLAAIEDVSKCFYVHKQKVVLAGYSSGGILSYKLGFAQSAKFAGLIIEVGSPGTELEFAL